MRILVISTLIILSSFTSLFSQQTIYLDNTPKEKIKLNNLKGIEFSGNALNDNDILNPYAIDINYQFNYFQELSLFSSVGVIVKGGMNMKRRIFMMNYSGSNNATSSFYNSISQSTFGEAHITIEPRWYFGYFYRQMEGKASLNSGWYLSAPIELSSNLSSHIGISFNPSLGYRQAVSKSIFIEGGLGVMPLFSTYASKTSLAPNVTLKVAYCL